MLFAFAFVTLAAMYFLVILFGPAARRSQPGSWLQNEGVVTAVALVFTMLASASLLEMGLGLINLKFTPVHAGFAVLGIVIAWFIGVRIALRKIAGAGTRKLAVPTAAAHLADTSAA